MRSPKRYFEMYNEIIIKALHSLGIKGLAQKGISDVCLRDKKVLGSSIYRNKDVLLYQAVLNISESVFSLEKYLKHPPREPNYRDKRSHKDFVTSLTAQGYHLSAEEIKKAKVPGLWQFFPVFVPLKTVGVMGDRRTYSHLIALRVVSSEDGMTCDWVRLPWELLNRISLRIVNELRGVNRVVYDITSKPPATIEWE